MIVVAVVVGFAVALCVAGWVPVVRDALRVDHVLPGPSAGEALPTVSIETTTEPPVAEPVTA